MNIEKKTLSWTTVNNFDFNQPLTDYGFVTRLADENKWTKNFTDKAILEYKKFMYLAATTGTMVSPSEIVDIVWHQHLIFTKSYNEFCDLLGRKIEHIPSTHNKAEFEKFKNAKNNTTKFYEKEFGKQPKDIWEYNTMYAPLNLQESTTTIQKIATIGSVISLILMIPLHFLLQPIYSQIDGLLFFLFYIPLVILVFSTLNYFNNSYLRSILKNWTDDMFIHNLDISEVIYLKSKNKSDVIHNAVNKLIKNKIIKIDSENTIRLNKKTKPKSIEEFVIIDSLKNLLTDSQEVFYPALLKSITNKEIFENTYQVIDEFNDKMKSSKRFIKLFLINYIAISSFMILGLVRLLMGVSNQRPVLFIIVLLILLLIISLIFLGNLSKKISQSIIPDFYKKTILPQKYGTETNHMDEWSYVYMNSLDFQSDFIPLVAYTSNSSSSSNSDGNSCGNSCGSSCGSSDSGSSCGSSCSSCGGGCGGCGG